MNKKRWIVLLTGLLLGNSAWSGELVMEFNGDLSLTGASRGASVTGSPRFAGEGAVVIGPADRLLVPSCGTLKSDAGTLEMRLSPRNWEAAAGSRQYFFYARQQRGNDLLMLSRDGGGKLEFSLGKLPRDLDKVEFDASAWQSGEAHSIKGVWNRETIALYIDGRLIGKKARRHNDLEWSDPMWLGGTIWAPAAGESALDFFRLSDQSEFSADATPARPPAAAAPFVPLDGNIATGEYRAVFIPGSQFKADKSKSVEMMADRIAGTWFMSEKNAPADNHWIEIMWPSAVSARALRVTPVPALAPRHGTLSYRTVDGCYVKIAELSGASETIEFPEVQTERLRLDWEPGPAGQIGIRELEVVGKAPRLFLPRPGWGGNFLWPREPDCKVACFRREFELPPDEKLDLAHFQISADDAWDLYVNGRKLGVGGFSVSVFDLRKHLRPGRNTIAVRAENFSGPAGLLAELTLAGRDGRIQRIASDESYQCSTRPGPDWFMPGDTASHWEPAQISSSLASYARNMRYYLPAPTASQAGFSIKSVSGLEGDLRPGDRRSVTVTLAANSVPDGDYGFRAIFGEEALSDNCDYTLTAADLMPAVPTSRWQPGQTYALTFELAIPSWAPHGQQPFRLQALNKKGSAPIHGSGDSTVMIRRFERDPVPSRIPPQCEIRLVGHQLRAVVGGQVMPPVIFALNSYMVTTYMQLGSEASIQAGLYRFAPSNCSLYVPDGMTPETFFPPMLAGIDQQVRQVLRFHPDAKLLIPLDCRINYARSRPDEAVMLSDGRKLMYSFSSVPWLEGAIAGGTRIIQHMLSSDYAGAIAGFVIITGAGGETMHWGYDANRPDALREKLVAGDFSIPAQRKFREFLRNRYGNDVQRLRRAWRRENIDFDTACLEIDELRRLERQAFRDPSNGSMAMDYWDFHSDSVAVGVAAIAEAFKKAGQGRPLIGGWGFYSFAVYPGIASRSPGGLQQIGAMSLDRVLECPAIDFVASIQSYSGVRGDTVLNTTMPAASLKKHRKLFVEEFDVRTFLVDLNKIADHHTTSEFETVNVMKRDFGETLARGDAAWFCGFAQGYTGRAAQGWFGADVLTKLLNRMSAIGRAMDKIKVGSAAEVALFVNNRDIAAMDMKTAAGILYNTQKNSVYGRYRGPVACEGIKSVAAPFDLYLLSDFSAELLKPYKLVVMLNAFYLDGATRAAIRAACEAQQKTVLWLYAPGYVGKDSACDVRNIAELTGIQVAETPEFRSDLGVTVLAGNGFRAHEIEPQKQPYAAGKLEIGPIFHVADPDATVLGRYRHNGKPALALKKVHGMTSVYCAVPLVTGELFRDLCKLAGVHVYTDAQVALNANDRVITVHAPAGADTVMTLPKAATVLDLYSGRVIGENVRSFPVKLPPRAAALYFTGTAAEVAEFRRQLP